MKEKHQILSEICEYYIDCIHSEEKPPSISDLEKRASILIQWMSEEDYDHILYEYKTGGYLGLYDVIDKLYIKSDIAQIDEAKSTYKKLVFRSIDEIKELKKDIRAQPYKLSINTLIILQKIIDILKKILLYANKNYIHKFIEQVINRVKEYDDEIRVEVPKFDDYLNICKCKNKIINSVEKQLKTDTLFDKNKWLEEINIKN